MPIRKRVSTKAKNGYTYQVYFYYSDKWGFNKQFTKSGFKTKKEAEAYEMKKKQEIENDMLLTNKKISLNHVADLYFENDPHTRQSTKEIRRSYYNKHLQGTYGNVAIDKLNYELLQNLFNDLAKTYKKATCENIFKTINAILKFGYNNGYISRIPYNRLKINGLDSVQKKQTLTFEEFKTLEDYYKKHRYRNKVLIDDNYRLLLNLGLYLGLRIGEAVALDRSDIDFNNNTISINKQYAYPNGITTTLKGSSSKAILPLPAPLKILFKEHFEKYPNTDLVIFDDEGTYINPKTAQSKFRILSKNTGIDFHYHMLRHTFVTQLWKKGIDTKTAQTLARHSDYQTTMNIYTNLDKENLVGVTDNLFS